MLNAVLEKVASELQRNALQSIDDSMNQSVRLLKLKQGEERLHANAVNLVLFATKAERDSIGGPSYRMHNADGRGPEEKSDLKLAVDLLFIFNFDKYEVALSAYSKVLEYFYNYDTINIPFDGQANEAQILLSSFTDQEELELWSSFNIPGTPILRYDLRYAIISGKS